MSYVSKVQQKLVTDLLLSRLSEKEFLRRFPMDRRSASAVTLDILRRGRDAHDAVDVEFGLYLGHHFGFTLEHVDVLCTLADAPWHECHEDVVDALASLKVPRAVDALYRAAAAEFPYRSYDDAHSLAVKAIYALSAIRNDEAVDRLEALANSGVQVVAETARDHLRRITSGN